MFRSKHRILAFIPSNSGTSPYFAPSEKRLYTENNKYFYCQALCLFSIRPTMPFGPCYLPYLHTCSMGRCGVSALLLFLLYVFPLNRPSICLFLGHKARSLIVITNFIFFQGKWSLAPAWLKYRWLVPFLSYHYYLTRPRWLLCC